jgi:ligand-binding sensor domain-containing protein
LLYAVSNGQHSDQENPKPAMEMYFSHLTREKGLPSDFVMHAIQDFRGYVWIATDNGLARYDGKNFTIFQSHFGKNNSIVDNYVIVLKESRDSMLWIGTRNGISIYNPFTGNFKNFPIGPEGTGTFPCRFIRSFYEDSDGSMWITSNEGLVYAEHALKKFVHIKINWNGDKEVKASEYNFLTCIAADPRNPSMLFLSTQGGILIFDKIKRTVVGDIPKIINGVRTFFDIFIDDQQRLWAGGWFNGLNCYDLKTEEWTEHPYNRKNPITVLSIFPKGNDEFWLGTIGMGLGVFNKKNGTFRFIRHDPLQPKSLLSDNINHLACFSKTRELWIMGTEGVSIENRKIFSFQKHEPPFSFLSLTDIYRDRDAGFLYAGAFLCNGLFVLNEKEGLWSLIREEKPNNGQPLNLINHLIKDRQGVLWMTTNKGLMFLDRNLNKLVLYMPKSGSRLMMKDLLASCLYEDPSGNLWVGTRSEGVIRIDPSRGMAVQYKHLDGDSGSIIEGSHHRAIKADRFNRIWISNQSGISIYEPKSDRFLNFFTDTLRKYGLGNRYVFNIENDTMGRMWLTIDGMGLLRVELKGDRNFGFKLFETTQGLDASSISSMQRDSEGDLWINNVSLVHFNPYTETFKLYDTQNGLHSMLGIGQKIHVDSDLNIFIAGESGYEQKNKRKLGASSGILNLIVENVEINGSWKVIGYGHQTPQSFVLTAAENNVTFLFTAICFGDVSNIKYMYKLEGYDKDWYLSDNSREARYTNLPPGQYEFIFKTVTLSSWKNNENRIELIIRPYFWQTWWFITLCLLVFFVLGYLGYSFRLRQLLRLERLRTRIATDLHDDVGSTLSSVSILSEMLSNQTTDIQSVKMLKSIGDSSSQMMEKLDDIVWVVNPSNDKFRDLGLRISEYAIPLFESKQLKFDIRFEEKLTGMRLPMEIRKNVYLIAKEAINNSLKYSDCSEVKILFRTENSGLYMDISDDGKGFDPETPTARNGLRNMSQRAKQINAHIEIISAHGRGTQVILKLKSRKWISNTA